MPKSKQQYTRRRKRASKKKTARRRRLVGGKFELSRPWHSLRKGYYKLTNNPKYRHNFNRKRSLQWVPNPKGSKYKKAYTDLYVNDFSDDEPLKSHLSRQLESNPLTRLRKTNYGQETLNREGKRLQDVQRYLRIPKVTLI